MILPLFSVSLWKESLNNNGQQSHQYQGRIRGISYEKSRFYAKKSYFFPILGGRGRGHRVRPPLAPPLNINKTNNLHAHFPKTSASIEIGHSLSKARLIVPYDWCIKITNQFASLTPKRSDFQIIRVLFGIGRLMLEHILNGEIDQIYILLFSFRGERKTIVFFFELAIHSDWWR